MIIISLNKGMIISDFRLLFFSQSKNLYEKKQNFLLL